MYMMLILVILGGIDTLVDKGYKLVFAPEEIELIRLDIPWVQPADNVTIMLYEEILAGNLELHEQVSKNILIHDFIKRIFLVIVTLLMIIEVKKFVVAIKTKRFFVMSTIRIIRNLSGLVVIWIVGKVILYEIIPWFIPTELMYERINFTTLGESWFESIVSALDIRMLFIAIILYLIYISFKEGYKLKEQADLTI